MNSKKIILIFILVLSSVSILFGTNHTQEDLEAGNTAGAGSSMEDHRDELPEDYFADEYEPTQEDLMNLPEEQEIRRAEAQQRETEQAIQDQSGNQQITLPTGNTQLSEELENQKELLDQTSQKVNALQSSITSSQDELNSKINMMMIMLGIVFFIIVLLIGFIIVQSKK